jgi:hypothetical protein
MVVVGVLVGYKYLVVFGVEVDLLIWISMSLSLVVLFFELITAKHDAKETINNNNIIPPIM